MQDTMYFFHCQWKDRWSCLEMYSLLSCCCCWKHCEQFELSDFRIIRCSVGTRNKRPQ